MSTLVAEGLIRRRRRALAAWIGAAAAAIVLVLGVSVFRSRHTPVPSNTYVMLLNVDSTYHLAPQGQSAARIAELVRWTDSLRAVGKFERGGRLIGSGPIGGMFLIRAANDADAARIAATCPFTKYGGHIDTKRFEE